MTQEDADKILAKITTGVKDICTRLRPDRRGSYRKHGDQETDI